MTKGWTEERRQKQAQWMWENRPWEKSTGPKSDKGKAFSSLNALKTGKYSAPLLAYLKLLAIQRAFLDQIIHAVHLDEERLDLKNELMKKKNKKKGLEKGIEKSGTN